MFPYCPKCQFNLKSTDIGEYLNCPRCNFTYYFNPAPAVAGIIVCKGEILFNVRAQAPCKGMLDLPGGFVDKGEQLEAALRREIREELGIIVGNWKYLTSQPNIYHYRGVSYTTCDAIFVAYVNEKPNIKKEDSEVENTLWLAPDYDLLKRVGFESLRKGIVYFMETREETR